MRFKLTPHESSPCSNVSVIFQLSAQKTEQVRRMHNVRLFKNKTIFHLHILYDKKIYRIFRDMYL